MKTLSHITLTTPDGKPIVDASSQKELNTATLITICLGQSKYPNVADQWKAYEITKKLEDPNYYVSVSKEGEIDETGISLEDADYQLVKKMVEAFEPYRNGFTFMPFLELFK